MLLNIWVQFDRLSVNRQKWKHLIAPSTKNQYSIGHVTLVAITGATLLMPYLQVIAVHLGSHNNRLYLWGLILKMLQKLDHIDGLVQNCKIANAMELLQSCTKPAT